MNFTKGLVAGGDAARRPGQCRRTRTGLDAADSLDHAAGEGEVVRSSTRRSAVAAQPVELAPLYVFLASNEARFVTGEVYGATGGQTPV